MKKSFSADFETATWLDDETYVWAWACCEIGNESNMHIGNDIKTFFEFMLKNEGNDFYFHNLRFDGEFILNYLLNNGYEYVEDVKNAREKTFTTLISDMGEFYSITIYKKITKYKKQIINIKDSLKIIPLSVDKMAKAFGLPISKLTLDYNKPREKGYLLKQEEIDYIKNDVLIVSYALNEMFKEGLTKLTIGSNALNDYKKIISINNFNKMFPKLDKNVDGELRKAYRGGFTYLNPIYKDKDTGKGITLDVNSLYPSCMLKPLPIDEPIYYKGKYEEDKIHPLYIQKIAVSFKIKKNKIPTIQIKEGFNYKANEYLKSSNGEIEILTLTSIDLKLFLEQYDTTYLEYIEGWKFKQMNGIFKDYIEKWAAIKIKATEEGNKGKRQIAKLLLNSLYGKFATKLSVKSKIPYLENDIVKYRLSEESEKEGLYIPAACFITAYAREVTIRTSQAITDYSIKNYNKDMYIYSDTDSISTTLGIDEIKQFCDISSTEIGKWDHENTFENAKFVRQKTYLKLINNEIHITCAGMPQSCYDFVTWDSFKEGFTCGGKLTYKHVKGGVKLIETDFTIKGDKKLKKSIATFN